MATEQDGFRRELVEALKAMVAPGCHPAYVVLNGDADAFIQFDNAPRRSEDGSFDLHSVIWIDRPCKGLTSEQAERAWMAFAELGLSGPGEERSRIEGGRMHMLATWRVDCGTDADKAAKVALLLFASIFGEQSQLRIDLGSWER